MFWTNPGPKTDFSRIMATIRHETWNEKIAYVVSAYGYNLKEYTVEQGSNLRTHFMIF